MKYCIMILLFLCSCSDIDQNETKTISFGYGISKIEYSGHSYIFFNQYQKCSLVHDPDCKCKIKNKGK